MAIGYFGKVVGFSLYEGDETMANRHFPQWAWDFFPPLTQVEGGPHPLYQTLADHWHIFHYMCVTDAIDMATIFYPFYRVVGTKNKFNGGMQLR